MDRIEKYLTFQSPYVAPYENHYGYGASIGCGDSQGCGRAYTTTQPKSEENGTDIISFNNHQVYCLNGYMLYITHIREPWAIGEIIKNDLTTQTCYIGKINNNIVVSDSIRNTRDELRTKIFKSKNNHEDLAQAFVLAHPDYNKEYDWDEMVTWHSLSTHSCSDGRRRFSMMAGKQSGDKATPKELVSFMIKSPSKETGLRMKRIYETSSRS